MGIGPEEAFSQRRYTDAQTHTWKDVNIIRELKTKITMRYHLMPFRMTVIKKGRNNKHGRGCEKTRPTHTVGENVNWCSHYGKQHSPQNIKDRPTIWSWCSTSGFLYRGYKNTNLKGICTLMLNTALLTTAKICNSISAHWRVNKKDVVYKYAMRHYSAIRKDENFPSVTTWMKREGIILHYI